LADQDSYHNDRRTLAAALAPDRELAEAIERGVGLKIAEVRELPGVPVY
jgi:hypothetical protein